MEFLRLARLLQLLVPGLALVAPAGAANFSVSFSSTPPVPTTNRSLVYTMGVTNLTGTVLDNVVVSSSFNETINFISATNTSGVVAIEGSAVVFRTPTLSSTGRLGLTLEVRPNAPGFLTNTLQLTADRLGTEVTNHVRRIYLAEANLGVHLLSATNDVVVGDWTSYRISITNGGPELVPVGTLTNLLPPGASLIGLNPSNAPVTQISNRITFDFTSLGIGQTQHYDLRFQPDSVATTFLAGTVGHPDLFDPVPANDTATNALNFVAPITSGLSVTFASTARFNPQTGLMEQLIRLNNVGDAAVAQSRVQLSGFDAAVYSASGTNSGEVFLSLARSLNPGESAELLLEYFSVTRTPLPDPGLTALQVPVFVPGAPAGTAVSDLRIVHLTDGSVLLEFASTPGAAYAVTYGNSVPLTDAVASLPTIYAPADKTQWIDTGPPRTSHHPGETSARFYRVIRLP